MKRSIKNILLSLAGFSAAPILTACYGTPDGYYSEYVDTIKGYVVDEDLKPIKGICVSTQESWTTTNEEGMFELFDSFYFDEVEGCIPLEAEDMDGKANGGFFGKEQINVNPAFADDVCIVMKKQ